MSFTIVELQILLGLAEAKTQAEIGAALHLDQPAISKALRAAQAKAGLPLIQRQGRRLRLTSAGVTLAQAAESVITQLHHVDQVTESLRAGRTGAVHLVATITPAGYVLPAVIGEFIRRYPTARVDLQIVPDNTTWATLADTAYELALGPQTVHSDELVAEYVYDDPLVFFASSGVALAARTSVTWTDLSHQPLIGSFAAVVWNHFVAEQQSPETPPPELIRLRSIEGVKRLVATGAGVGVLLESSVRHELETEALWRLPVESPPRPQSFYLMRQRGTLLSPIARRFRDFLLRQLATPSRPAAPAAPANAVL
jgi:LysR family transcriptional regulator, low CO2-responsive transcriptional regulator